MISNAISSKNRLLYKLPSEFIAQKFHILKCLNEGRAYFKCYFREIACLKIIVVFRGVSCSTANVFLLKVDPI